ncbi:putative quinol monooxygenase [Streptomyces milbemycinicus]|uniref:putative quinol monooxygenase n=1 Tax=Streptomyces milbemycinicus TaxID=476552 RepID=UPI0033CD69C2
MSLVVVAECVAEPGQEDRLRTALEALIEPSLEEPGCLAYRPYADPNNPGHMVVVAEWTDPEALARHGTTPHVRHARQVLDLVLAEPMAVRRLLMAARPPG